MKVISIWQPYANLIVQGFKVFETRTWAAPQSVIGQTIGIASTKTLNREQKALYEDSEFQRFYELTGHPDLKDLPFGYLLGTVTLDSVHLMTEEFMEDVSEEEKTYGWWVEGSYAWSVTNPVALKQPIVIRGAQGIYEWNGILPDETKEREEADP